MLSVWHYIAIALPLILLGFEWRHARARVMAILFAGIILASMQVAADLRIRAIRELSWPVPISSLPHTDPLRRRFGLLHGVSSLLLLAQVGVAAIAVVSDDRVA
jgi:hypothetical protein